MADVLINFRARNESRSAIRQLKGDIDALELTLRSVQQIGRVVIGLGGDLRRAEEARVASVEELERETAERIASINERKADRLRDISQRIEAEERRRVRAIEGLFSDARDAEVEARSDAASAILRIEADTERRRRASQAEYYRELRELEADLARDIEGIREDFSEREERREAERLEIVRNAAAERISVEAAYQARVVEINRRLVDSVREVRADLSDRLAELDAGLVAREASRAASLVEISENAAVARLSAEERYVEQIVEINRGLVVSVRSLQSDLARQLADLTSGFAEREESRASRLVEAEQEAVAGRIAAQEAYQEAVIGINRDLVRRVEDLQRGLVDRLSEIDAGLVSRESARADALVALARETAERRISAEAAYQDRVLDINRGLVDSVREVQGDIRRIEAEAVRDREAVISDAVDSRASAELAYSVRVQGVYNDLASEVTRIEQNLTNRLDRIRDRRLAAEEDRVAAEARLRRGTDETIFDRRLSLGRDLEDVLREGGLREDLSAEELGRTFGRRDVSDTSRILGTFDADILESVADLRRSYFRDLEDIEREASRERVEIAETASRRQSELDREAVEATAEAERARGAASSGAGVDIETALANAVPSLSAMEQAAQGLSETLAVIDAQEVSRLREIETSSAREIAAARSEIFALEREAGISFSDALTNLVPEVDASRRALNDFNAVLEQIALDEVSRRGGILAAGEADRQETAVRRGEAVSEVEREISALEARAGISFEEALGNFVPEVDASTQALNTFNEAIASINAELLGERAGIVSEGAADRVEVEASRVALTSETEARIAELEARAGISFEAALGNFVPEVDASTRALNAFTAVLDRIASEESERRGSVLAAGALDRETVAGERAGIIADADRQIAGLEADAGISFSEALAVYTPALSASAEALEDFRSNLERIRREELSALSGVSAARVLDRQTTDEAIAERRAQFDADVRGAELDAQTRLIDIEYAAGQQIAEVNANLKVELGEINVRLSEALAAIRENKIEFDNEIFAEIREIERVAAADIAEVNADAAVMRGELEAIAAEARDNAWKKGILKLANIGITIAGVAAGAVVGGPAGAQAGAEIGGVVGGLVEQAGNELFHSPENDLLAVRAGIVAARGRSVAFSPDAIQRQNAGDFSRYFGEGFASERERQPTGESNARPIIVQLIMNDRVIQEVFARGSELRLQERLV